jgi:hypothetical protein
MIHFPSSVESAGLSTEVSTSAPIFIDCSSERRRKIGLYHVLMMGTNFQVVSPISRSTKMTIHALQYGASVARETIAPAPPIKSR